MLAIPDFHLAGVTALVAQERVAKLDDARAQLAHDAEVAQLKLSKLQIQFSNMLAIPHITLHSLRGSTIVSSFQDVDVPQELQVKQQCCKLTVQQQKHATNAVMHNQKMPYHPNVKPALYHIPYMQHVHDNYAELTG